jgi:HAD superfamily hydrolase (TIGR01509 family)
MARFSAVIFDMDGVLVDGEPLHFAAVNELLAEEGRSISLDEYRPYMGTKAGWREMVSDLGLARPYEYYSPRYNELITSQYRACSVASPGAIASVSALRSAGIPVAVCSSSIEPWVTACLETIGLLADFEVLVTGSDIEHGKPAPDIYLLAAERLGVDPATCLAIEDAPAGIASAKAAGMTCWAVRTEYTRGIPLPGADRELESLLEIEVADITGVAA